MRNRSRTNFFSFLVLLLLAGVITAIVQEANAETRRKKKQVGPEPTYTHACPKDFDDKLVIHHIAVGQGDSTFIRTPKGRTILIDAALPGRGETEIVPTLKQCYGITNLDYVVLTHFDHDHHGSMSSVLEALPPMLAVYDPGEDMNTKNDGPGSAYKKYADAANATKKRAVPKLGSGSIALADDDPTAIEIVAMNGKVKGDHQVDIWQADGELKDDNSISIAMTVRLGDFDYFIGGDLTGGGDGTPDVETPTADVVGDVDVLHANHHGSKTSNNEHFLKTLSPERIVISVGDDGLNLKKYRLPTDSVIERMDDFAFIRAIFQTSAGASQAPKARQKKISNEDQDVIIVSDGNAYTVNGRRFSTDGEGGAHAR